MHVLAVPDTIKQHGNRTLNMQLAAIGVLFGSALVLGNASFIFLSVPTVQMLKVSQQQLTHPSTAQKRSTVPS